MYEKHFGLRQRPFRSTPDCSRYYPSTIHEDALAALQQAILDEEGLILLTGEPGLGKTLLCHCLLQRVGDSVRSGFLTNSHLGNRLELLQAIAFEMGLVHDGRGEQSLRLAVTEDLLSHCAAGQPLLLFVDEAHHLTLDVLEELRLLANLEGNGTRALQVVLVAHPEIHRTLEHPALLSLRQRMAVRARLCPLTETEAADYLLHHLRVATDRPDKLMTQEALALLARGTRGVPRLLSQAAHRALMLACLAGATTVDAEAAMEAMLALGLEVEEPGQDEGLTVLRKTA
jgi:type II secretory pathway predicted ATPase ExeA